MRLQHQASQIDGENIPIPPDSEIFKTQDGTGAALTVNGEADFGNVDLSQMDPESIRVILFAPILLTLGRCTLEKPW